MLESTFPGCRVDEATSATDAWGLARTRPYDLILADAALPDGHGAAFLERAAQACPGARRVLLADPAHPEEAQSALRRGAAHGTLPRQATLADATTTLRRLAPDRSTEQE